jgi:small subunit ribosomal protein S25e
MGGKKKLNLKQMERMQDKKDEEDSKKDKKKDKTGAPKEKKPLSILSPDTKSDKTLAEVKKMNVLTPYMVATRFNVRISAAKDFLEQLEKDGKIARVSGSHNIKIYKIAA